MNKQETIKKLNEIKQGLNASIPQYTYEEAYNEIYNTVADFDGNENLEGALFDFGIVDYDTAEDMAKQRLNDGGLSSVICFLAGVNYLNDDIYMLDGYANLQNVKYSDFVDLIDELLDNLKD